MKCPPLFVFTTRTTQPRPQVFSVNGALTCKNAAFLTSFPHKHKILPNWVISKWLWWIKTCGFSQSESGKYFEWIITQVNAVSRWRYSVYCWNGLLLDIYHISVGQSIYRLKKWAKPTPKHHLLSCKYSTYTAVQVKALIFVKYYRVQKELKQLQSLKPHGIEVSIPSDSLQLWEAMVPGPEESLYKGINPCTGAKSKHWAPEVMQLSSFS